MACFVFCIDGWNEKWTRINGCSVQRWRGSNLKPRNSGKALMLITKPYKTFLVCFLKLRDSESVGGSLSYHRKESLSYPQTLHMQDSRQTPSLVSVTTPSPRQPDRPTHPLPRSSHHPSTHHPCISSLPCVNFCGTPNPPRPPSPLYQSPPLHPPPLYQLLPVPKWFILQVAKWHTFCAGC